MGWGGQLLLATQVPAIAPGGEGATVATRGAIANKMGSSLNMIETLTCASLVEKRTGSELPSESVFGENRASPKLTSTAARKLTFYAIAQGDSSVMSANQLLFNSTILSFGLILVGLALGFLILKIQGGEAE